MNILPCFKKIHPVFETEPGILRVGESPDSSFELADENGSVRKLIELLDGTRSVEEIYAVLNINYPNLSYAEVIEAVEELHSLGFLYDASLEEVVSLEEVERERFKANINFFSHYADFRQSPGQIQERLKNSSITIIGMGAFGSGILSNLAGLGVQNVCIVDYDTVELSNLNRQMLFSESDIGRVKIEAARDFMHRFYSDMKITTVQMKIESSEGVEQVIAGSDLVILAADQPFVLIQHWVNQACVKLRIPLIGGGVIFTKGQFFTVIPEQTGCLDCMFLTRAEMAEDYPQYVDKFLSEDISIPTAALAPNIMMITGMISLEAVRLLTGIGTIQASGKILMFDFMTLEKEELIEWERQKECPTCGEGNDNHPIFQAIVKNEKKVRSVIPS